MKFYDVARSLYLETDTSGIGLGAGLLQVRDGMNSGHDKVPDNVILCPITFTSKTLSCVEQCYSNTEHDAMEILHGLERFHHYCFAREVCIITDHMPLVAILNREVATLSQWLQHIILRIHQYSVQIIHKPGPDLYITDWLPRNNHADKKHKEIVGMSIHVSIISTSVNMPVCTSTEDIHQHKKTHSQKLKIYIIQGWPQKRERKWNTTWDNIDQ